MCEDESPECHLGTHKDPLSRTQEVIMLRCYVSACTYLYTAACQNLTSSRVSSCIYVMRVCTKMLNGYLQRLCIFKYQFVYSLCEYHLVSLSTLSVSDYAPSLFLCLTSSRKQFWL